MNIPFHHCNPAMGNAFSVGKIAEWRFCNVTKEVFLEEPCGVIITKC
jgi:hypothetical protein